MKVVRLKSPASLDNLALCNEAAPPPPGPGEIQVRIRASSLNFHDWGVVSGRLSVDDGRIPLSDGAGEIVALGAGISGLAVGDIVTSLFFPDWISGRTRPEYMGRVPGDYVDGFAREIVNVPARDMIRAPAGYSPAEAATLTCAGVTAWRALVTDGPVQPGEAVLVEGSGGVSIFALQFAKMMGAQVIATSSSDAKLARLKALGADHVINYSTTPEWGQAARELTGGRGVDHIVEVGGASSFAQAIEACCSGGHIAMIGVLAGVAAPVSTRDIMWNQLRVQGLTVGSRADMQAMIRAIEVSGIRPVIDRHFPLDQLADAFRFQKSGGHFGKICIDI